MLASLGAPPQSEERNERVHSPVAEIALKRGFFLSPDRCHFKIGQIEFLRRIDSKLTNWHRFFPRGTYLAKPHVQG